MRGSGGAGRQNQRRRTRKDLLEAASRLMRQGRKPSLEEIAEEALVSRATAYRYFPNVEALLLEASLDVAVPSADELFGEDAPVDPLARLQMVEDLLHDLMVSNEPAFRLMLAQTLELGISGAGELPARQNRRSPLIAAALKPARRQFDPQSYDKLTKALALIIGGEAIVVFKDVLQVDDAEARAVKRWAIRALVAAARRPES